MLDIWTLTKPKLTFLCVIFKRGKGWMYIIVLMERIGRHIVKSAGSMYETRTADSFV